MQAFLMGEQFCSRIWSRKQSGWSRENEGMEEAYIQERFFLSAQAFFELESMWWCSPDQNALAPETRVHCKPFFFRETAYIYKID